MPKKKTRKRVSQHTQVKPADKILRGLHEALDMARAPEVVRPSERAINLAKGLIIRARAKGGTDDLRTLQIAEIIDATLRTTAAHGEVRGMGKGAEETRQRLERQTIQGFLSRVALASEMKQPPETTPWVVRNETDRDALIGREHKAG